MTDEEIFSIINEDIRSDIRLKMSADIRKKAFSKLEKFICEYNTPFEYVNKIKAEITKIFDAYDDIYKNFPDDTFLLFSEFPNDIRKIQKDFFKYGFNISSAQAEALWIDRSNEWFAQWLEIEPETNTFIEFLEYDLIKI